MARLTLWYSWIRNIHINNADISFLEVKHIVIVLPNNRNIFRNAVRNLKRV